MHEIRDCEGKRLQPFGIITNSQFHYSVSPSKVLAYFLTHWQMAEKKILWTNFALVALKRVWHFIGLSLLNLYFELPELVKKTACQVKASNEIPPMSPSRWKHQRIMLIKLKVNFKEKFNSWCPRMKAPSTLCSPMCKRVEVFHVIQNNRPLRNGPRNLTYIRRRGRLKTDKLTW